MAIIEAPIQPKDKFPDTRSTDRKNRQERSFSAEADLLSLRETYGMLAEIESHRVNAYARDGREDEIAIEMPNGKMEGYFKTFSIPLVPFLEAKRLSVYSAIHKPITDYIQKHPDASFEQALQSIYKTADTELADAITEALQIYSEWTTTSLEKPARLKNSISYIVAQSLETDTCLTQVIKEEDAKTEVQGPEAVAHKAAQLNLGFGVASPFYAVEATLDKKRKNFPFDPVQHAENALILKESQPPGSNFEALFDAAAHSMKNIFDTATKQAGTMDWQVIRTIVQDVIQDSDKTDQARVLSEITWKTSHDPDEIMYALWKKCQQFSDGVDVPEQSAIKDFEASLATVPATDNNETIIQEAGKLNAIIRFHGDTPAHKDAANFSGGKQLVYGSICDTTQELEQLVLSCPEIWSDSFIPTFDAYIKPQMAAIPQYSSARGRLLLDLLLNTPGALKPEYREMMDTVVHDKIRTDRYLDRLTELRSARQIRKVGDGITSSDLIGGKAKGLEHANRFLSNVTFPCTEAPRIMDIKVADGIEVTTERVEEMILRANPDLYRTICVLHNSNNPEEQTKLSEQIHDAILGLKLNDTDIAEILGSINNLRDEVYVRSSATDEASEEDKYAAGHAGFYESYPTTKANITAAILKVMASYYNPGGAAFRNIKGLGHMPRMALLIQENIPQTTGGNVLIDYDENMRNQEVLVTAAQKAADITSGQNNYSYVKKEPIFAEDTDAGYLYAVKKGRVKISPIVLETIDSMQARLSTHHRRSGMLEIGVNENTLVIFQQQMYPRTETDQKAMPFPDIQPAEFSFGNTADINILSKEIESTQGPIKLIINGNPDASHLGSQFRALCIKYNDRIQDIKIHAEPPPSTSHLGMLIRNRFPWLNWESIWIHNTEPSDQQN